jgi:hypothetical protein
MGVGVEKRVERSKKAASAARNSGRRNIHQHVSRARGSKNGEKCNIKIRRKEEASVWYQYTINRRTLELFPVLKQPSPHAQLHRD